MLQVEDRQEDASAVLRAIQVENEALQRAILSRKAEPPASALQVQARSWAEGRDRGGLRYSGTRQCLISFAESTWRGERDVGGSTDLPKLPFLPPCSHFLFTAKSPS